MYRQLTVARARIRRKPVALHLTSQHDGVASAISETAYLSHEFIALDCASVGNIKTRGRPADLLSSAKKTPSATATLPADRESAHEPKTIGTPARRSRILVSSWTSPLSLATFCLLFVLVLATLVLLSQLSRARDGFNVPSNVSPYTWKYGPTAVMTIIVALWRQVDRQTKTDQPWIELSVTSAPSSKTLLLDYASPILPVALWMSLRNKHWRVAIVIMVSALLQVAVAFSTSLLVVHTITTPVSQVPLMLRSPYVAPALPAYDTWFVDQVYGNVVNELEYPPGISARAAFQVLSTANQLPFDTQITAEVTAAFPDLLCEPASLTANFTTKDAAVTHGNGLGNLTITTLTTYFDSKYCYGSTEPAETFDVACNIRTGSGCTSDVYYVTTKTTVNCLAFQDRSNVDNTSIAFLFVLLALSPPAQPNESFVQWSSGALCESHYVVEKANLTGNSNNIDSNNDFTLSEPLNSVGEIFPGYSPSNLTYDVATIAFASFNGESSVPPSSSTANYDNVDGWFRFMLTNAGISDIETLQSFSVMAASANRMYQQFAVYPLARQLALSDSLNTQGSYLNSEAKLFVTGSSVWIVMAITGIAIIFTVALVSINARQETIRGPSSLSELPSYVTSGSLVFELLNGTGRKSTAQISDRLSRHTFSSVLVSKRCVRLQARSLDLSGTQKTDKTTDQTAVSEYWVPFSAWRSFVAVCIVVPAIEIIVLEILQRKSDAHQGFGDTHTSLQISQNIAALVPAAIMLSTAALYSAAEWSIGVFTPFSLARNRPVSLKRINQSSADVMAPIAIVQTLRKRQYGAAVIILSTMLGSFLTIITSGLYSLQVVPRLLTVSLSTTTQFDTTWDQLSNLTASSLFSLVELHNASYPDGTIEDLAFPLLQFNEVTAQVQGVIDNATFVDVDVPVLRAHLDCTVPPQDKMSYGIQYEIASSSLEITVIAVAQLNVTMDVPDECQYSSGIYQNSSQLTISHDLRAPSIPWVDSRELATILSVEGHDSNISGESTAGAFPPYCPSIAFAAGRFSNDTSIEDKTVLVCTQLQQEIPATLRFSLPDLSLDLDTRPKIDESRAKVVSGHQYHFKSIFDYTAETAIAPSAVWSDEFYQTVVNLTGIPIDAMIGPDNEALFYNQTESLYRSFMAQVFGAAMRVKNPQNGSVNASVGTTPAYTQLNGTIYDNERLRVIQHRTSKIVLQVMLGVMMFCAGAAFSMVSIRDTLPHDPCSIAGKLSLLIGSRFAEECADIAELCDDAEEPGRRLRDCEVKFGWQKRDREESSDETSPPPSWFGLDFWHVADVPVSSGMHDDQQSTLISHDEDRNR